MKRIAILGCENSHANAFLKFIREREEFSDVEVVGVYSDQKEAAEKLREQFGVPVLDDYGEAVGGLDCLIITARHGDNHYKYAKPYMDAGIPMFIDKPITCSEEEAVAFMREARDRGIRLCGGSIHLSLLVSIQYDVCLGMVGQLLLLLLALHLGFLFIVGLDEAILQRLERLHQTLRALAHPGRVVPNLGRIRGQLSGGILQFHFRHSTLAPPL